MIHSENDAVVARKLGGPAVRPGRGAMQEIGNSLALVKKDAKVGKPEAVKPPRGLTKQRGAVLSKAGAPDQAARERPKKNSLEKQVEPMEISLLGDEMDHQATEPEAASRAFPAERMALVEDIDKDDEDDPQLVTDYVNQIYIYLRNLEQVQSVEADYLGGQRGGSLLPKMRAVLVDWLVEVHQQFSMLQETLFLTVAILDRYLQRAATAVNRKSLQLVGVTAMFVASKYEEMYAPEIGDFVYITDGAYTQAQIRQQEIDILKVLNFDLGRPLPLHFLRRNSKAGCVDARVHTLAKYLMELTLVEYSMMHVPPSMLAAAALAISMKFFDDEGSKALSDYWTPTLAYYTMYEWMDIGQLAQGLLTVVVRTCEARPDAKLMAIRQKYTNKKFGRIAVLAQNKVSLFHQMKSLG